MSAHDIIASHTHTDMAQQQQHDHDEDEAHQLRVHHDDTHDTTHAHDTHDTTTDTHLDMSRITLPALDMLSARSDTSLFSPTAPSSLITSSHVRIDMGCVYGTDHMLLRCLTLHNTSQHVMHIHMSSTLPQRIAFQLHNDNIDADGVLCTQDDMNQMWNCIDHVEYVSVDACTSQRIIIVFNPTYGVVSERSMHMCAHACMSDHV